MGRTLTFFLPVVIAMFMMVFVVGLGFPVFLHWLEVSRIYWLG